jgi:predicted small integral membrane protein
MGIDLNLEWMAWTLPTAILFATLFLMIAAMTVLSLISPSVPRKGFLPMTTTRGDRLYIGLLGAAFINLIWLGVTDLDQLYGALLSAAWLAALMRWG